MSALTLNRSIIAVTNGETTPFDVTAPPGFVGTIVPFCSGGGTFTPTSRPGSGTFAFAPPREPGCYVLGTTNTGGAQNVPEAVVIVAQAGVANRVVSPPRFDGVPMRVDPPSGDLERRAHALLTVNPRLSGRAGFGEVFKSEKFGARLRRFATMLLMTGGARSAEDTRGVFGLGVNLSGAENEYPAFPGLDNMQYLAAHGIKRFRLPLQWRGLQPVAGGPLAAGYLSQVSAVLANAALTRTKILIDIHNFGFGPGGLINAPGGPTIAQFADFWRQLSLYFLTDPNYAAICGYDLMNEWHDVNPDAPGDESSPYVKNLVFQCNQQALSAIRGNGDSKTIHIEGSHYSGAWDWVSNNGDWALQLVDPLDNLVFHVHCYLDSDSSGLNFAYDVEAAKPGYAPPGISTSPTIGPQRMASVVAWAEEHGKKLCLGECGWGSDRPVSGNAAATDNFADWNLAATNMLDFCREHGVEVYMWGNGPGFPPSYGYCAEPRSLVQNSNAKDFTTAGLQSTQMVVVEAFTGYQGPQPTSFAIRLPITIVGSTSSTQRYATVGQPMGADGGVAGTRYLPFTIEYNGILDTPATITPVVTLADGVTAAPGTATPAAVVLQPGINPRATFTFTPTAAATMLIGATNDRGWTNPPLQSFSSINDIYRVLGNVPAPVLSLRREVTYYVGPALRLRRRDGVERDFYFDNLGNLPRQAIQDWASSRNVDVAHIYDGSENGRGAELVAGKDRARLVLDPNAHTRLVFDGGAHCGYTIPFDAKFASQLSFLAHAFPYGYDNFLRQDYYTGPLSWSLSSFGVRDPRDTPTNPGTGFNQTINFAGPVNSWHQFAATLHLNALTGQKLYLDGTVQAQASTVGAYTELHTNGDYGNDLEVQLGYFIYYGPSAYRGELRNLRMFYGELTAGQMAPLRAADAAYYATPLPDTLSAVAPTVFGGVAVAFVNSVAPFADLTVLDDNAGATDSVSIAIVGGGTLTGTGLTGTGPYAMAADTPGNITSKLRGLSFSWSAPGGAVAHLTVTVSSSAGTSTTITVDATKRAYGSETPYPSPGSFVPISFKGVNLSGGENVGQPIYPKLWQIDYFASKGFGLIRLPLDHGNIVTAGGAALRDDALVAIKAVLDRAFTKRMRVVLDLHTYGAAINFSNTGAGAIGVSEDATDGFADVWSRLASRFKNYPNVIFGLMNEPSNQNAAQWKSGCLRAIGAIRATGATQLVLIPGVGFTGAHWWTSQGNAAQWQGFSGDSNFAFEMHQYLDGNDSGTHPQAVSGKGATVLDQGGGLATSWARSNGFRIFLGEFGFAPNAWKPASNPMGYDPAAATIATGGQTEGAALLAYMNANADVWMGWAAWVGGDFGQPPNPGGYAYCLDPLMEGDGYRTPIVDQPQMTQLLAAL